MQFSLFLARLLKGNGEMCCAVALDLAGRKLTTDTTTHHILLHDVIFQRVKSVWTLYSTQFAENKTSTQKVAQTTSNSKPESI